MTTGRCAAAVVAALIVVTVTLQVSVFSHFAFDGVAPDLALLLVIGAALVRGPEYAAVVGFAAGLVLDLAPPADHTAGRWALVARPRRLPHRPRPGPTATCPWSARC